MGEAIVITSGKGGVGKTTTTANLGAALALEGKKVVMLDGDIGLRNLDVVMGMENRVVYTIIDVIKGVCEPQKALIRCKKIDGLYLLPAAQTEDKTAITPDQMREVVNKLKQDFDYVLIDCPAGIEQGFHNAIAGADKAIVVTMPEVSAIRDADRAIGLLFAREGGQIEPVLIINRMKEEMAKRGDMLNVEDTIEILGLDLLGAVPYDDEIVISTNKGEPVVTYPTSKAAKEYRSIAKRLLGEDIPHKETEPESGGLISLFKNIFKLGIPSFSNR